MPWVEPGELEERLEAFYNHCEETDENPDSFLLSRMVGINDREVVQWKHWAELSLEGLRPGEIVAVKKKKRVGELCQDLVAFREHFYQIKLFNSKNVAGAAFALKQPKNGGWKDREETKGNNSITITVNTTGVGGDRAFE